VRGLVKPSHFSQQRLINRKRGLRSFGGRDDYELHISRGIAGDVNAIDASLNFVFTDCHTALVIQRAA
jgi:hypothetical protein